MRLSSSWKYYCLRELIETEEQVAAEFNVEFPSELLNTCSETRTNRKHNIVPKCLSLTDIYKKWQDAQNSEVSDHWVCFFLIVINFITEQTNTNLNLFSLKSDEEMCGFFLLGTRYSILTFNVRPPKVMSRYLWVDGSFPASCAPQKFHCIIELFRKAS